MYQLLSWNVKGKEVLLELLYNMAWGIVGLCTKIK